MYLYICLFLFFNLALFNEGERVKLDDIEGAKTSTFVTELWEKR